MLVELMNTISPYFTVTKLISSTKQFDVELKDATDVLNPIIILSGAGVTGYNYMHIPDFGRYYFLNDPITRTADIVEIQGRVDPLMSWANQIRANAGVVDRQSQVFNRYYNDNLPAYAYKVTATKVFSKSFNDTKSTILVACGGK